MKSGTRTLRVSEASMSNIRQISPKPLRWKVISTQPDVFQKVMWSIFSF